MKKSNLYLTIAASTLLGSFSVLILAFALKLILQKEPTSLEVPSCAATAHDAVTLSIPLCSQGCYLESKDLILPASLCEKALVVRAIQEK